MRPKFGSCGTGDEVVPYDYGNLYFREPCGPQERLMIGPRGSHVSLLLDLLSTFSSTPYFVLYVLLISRTDLAPGRYQSPPIEGRDILDEFLSTFQPFLEGDGRHHLWIAAPDSGDMLVYDQHNVIFAYGDLDAMESILQAKGFRNQEFGYPVPHMHCYNAEFDESLNDLMAYFPWQYSELRPGDD